MSHDNSVWPPPPSNQAENASPSRRTYPWLKTLAAAVAAGLALGLLDACTTNDVAEWLTDVVAGVFGLLRPKLIPLIVFLLSLCLYLVHVAAIRCGFGPPYVEPTTDQALLCWWSLIPNGISGLIGVLVGVFLRLRRQTLLDETQ